MNQGAPFGLAGLARYYGLLAILFAAALLRVEPAGNGVGLVSGLILASALIIHGLVFGAAASRAFLPFFFAKQFVAAGFVTVIISTRWPDERWSGVAAEGGLFFLTLGALALVFGILVGRARMLREGDY